MDHPTVLVIDDDVELLEMLEFVLESEGFKIHCERNGADGLKALDRFQTFQVILLDLMMPIMNGFEFLERLAERPDRDIPVIVLTAAEPSLLKQPILNRVAGITKKPFNVAELISLLKDVLMQGSQKRAIVR